MSAIQSTRSTTATSLNLAASGTPSDSSPSDRQFPPTSPPRLRRKDAIKNTRGPSSELYSSDPPTTVNSSPPPSSRALPPSEAAAHYTSDSALDDVEAGYMLMRAQKAEISIVPAAQRYSPRLLQRRRHRSIPHSETKPEVDVAKGRGLSINGPVRTPTASFGSAVEDYLSERSKLLENSHESQSNRQIPQTTRVRELKGSHSLDGSASMINMHGDRARRSSESELLSRSSSITIRPHQSCRRALSADAMPMTMTPEVTKSQVKEQDAHKAPSFLPAGSDLEEWGTQFWVVIIDPGSGHEFFYNPSLGEARWRLGPGTPVLPVNPEGNWLQFYDGNSQRFYYYHSGTGVTQWDKPHGMVIPVKALQDNLNEGDSGAISIAQAHVDEKRPLSRCLSAPSSPHRDCALLPDEESDAHAIDEKTTGPALLTPTQPSGSSAKEVAIGNGSPFPPRKSSKLNEVSASLAPQLENDKPVPPPRQLRQRRRSVDPAVRFVCELQSITERSISTSVSPASDNFAISREIKQTVTLVDKKAPPVDNKGRKQNRIKSVGSLLKIPRPPATFQSDVNGLDLSAKKGGTPSSESSPKSQRTDSTANGKGGDAEQGRPTRISLVRKKSKAYLKQLFGTPSPPPFEQFIIEGQLPKESDQANEEISIPCPSYHDLRHFQDFMTSSLSTQRRGVFQKRLTPMESLIWQENPSLAPPFLHLDKDLHRVSACIFKVILRICGERSRSVFFPKPPPVALGYNAQAKGSRAAGDKLNDATLQHPKVPANILGRCKDTRNCSKDETSTIWEEQKWLLEVAICNPSLRDETFCQLLTRLNKSSPTAFRTRAWRFLSVAFSTFVPSSEALLTALGAFIPETYHCAAEHDEVVNLARHAERRKNLFLRRSARSKCPLLAAPSLAEIQAIWTAASQSMVFGQSLTHIMTIHNGSVKRVTIPPVLLFLFKGLVDVGEHCTRGLFDITGDTSLMLQLRSAIDNGCFSLQRCNLPIDDAARLALPLAYLIKTLFEEMEDALIPPSMYNECLSLASRDDAEKAVSFISSERAMPSLNRRTLLFLIAALQSFCDREVSEKTGVDLNSISNIFGPIVLRCPSLDSTIIEANVKFEARFFHLLLSRLEWRHFEEEFDPEVKDLLERLTRRRRSRGKKDVEKEMG